MRLKSVRRRSRRLALLATVSLSARLAGAAEPTPRVTVLAQPRFDELSHAGREDGTIELRARLLDDAGQPLSTVTVVVGSRGGSRALRLSSCEPTAPRARRARGALTEVTTGADGRLCLLAADTSASGAVELTFAGGPLHLPARAEMPLQAARSEVQLAFSAPSLELDLDQPTQRLQLEVSGADPREPFPDIELSLHEGPRERSLTGTDWARSEDTLAFDLASEQLGSPGPARLVARYRGSALLEPAQSEAVALRVASVRLAAEILTLDESGAQLRVSADTAAGPPTSGRLEVSAGGDSIASSSFVAGVADVWLPALATESGHVTLRYRADDPWWRAGEPLELGLQRAPLRRPARWPWLVLLAPVGYVCLRSMQRPALRKPARRRAPPRRAPELSGASRLNPAGWMGTVSDAHEGRAIAGAHVEALLPSLRAGAVGFRAITDASGQFRLPAHPDPLPEGARLRVTAPLHTEVERPLPPQGRVDIALVSRRRELLRRLVRWARSVGPPWARASEPTPAEIADVAVRRGDTRTAEWAERIEAAAFGDAPVDQTLEATLRAQEPPWQHAGQQSEEREDE